MSLFGWLRGDRQPGIWVHVLVRGRIGDAWYDVDRRIKVPPGTTLAELVARGESFNLPLEVALRDSPHLRDTLMLNGERCPIEEEGGRVLAEGDQIYLLAPLAGG